MIRGKRKTTRVGLRETDLLTDQLRKDFEEEELARRRMGDTPEARLRWVVTFAQRDLDALRPEERVALGYDVRALIPDGWQITRDIGPMSEVSLRKLQKEIAVGIQSLLRSPTLPWALPGARRAYLTRVRDAGEQGSRVQLTWEGDEANGIIGGVWDLLLQAGHRLRACDNEACRKPFVARKRQMRGFQVFCSPACGQAVRNLRKKRRRSKGGAASHRTSG